MLFDANPETQKRANWIIEIFVKADPSYRDAYQETLKRWQEELWQQQGPQDPIMQDADF